MNKVPNGGPVIKASVAYEIQCQLEILADRLAEVNQRVRAKLDPVMMPEREEPCNEPPASTEPMIPPYFEELRRIGRRMNASIDNIENALNRTAL